MGTPYAVDIIFQAIDQSQRGTTSFLRQIEQVDSAIKRTTAASGMGGGAGGEAGGGRSAVDQVFSGLTNRLLGVAGLRAGVDAVTVGIRIWQYESTKLKAPLDEVLRKHININEAISQIVRDIPFIGQVAARLMDVFSHTEFLKESRVIFTDLDKMTERMATSIESMRRDIIKMRLENAGAPASEIALKDIQYARKDSEKDLINKRAEVEKARKAYHEMQKIERETPRRIAPQQMGFFAKKTEYLPVDTTKSDKERIKFDAARKELKELEETTRKYYDRMEVDRVAKMRKEEEVKLRKTRTEEGEQRLGVQQKEMERRNKERGDELSWERDQRQRVEELNAQKIKDKVEREKKAIEIKYRYEIQKAREAFHDTKLLEEQRRLELAGVKPDEIKGRSHPPGKTPAEEVRFVSGAYGYNAGYDPAMQTARHAGTQVELMQKMNRKFDELIQIIRGQPTNSLRLSNFS